MKRARIKGRILTDANKPRLIFYFWYVIILMLTVSAVISVQAQVRSAITEKKAVDIISIVLHFIWPVLFGLFVYYMKSIINRCVKKGSCMIYSFGPLWWITDLKVYDRMFDDYADDLRKRQIQKKNETYIHLSL